MTIMIPFIIATLFFGGLFLYLRIKRPQTIWLGITFVLCLLNLAFIVVTFFLPYHIQSPLYGMAILFALIILPAPFITIMSFLINGVRIIRNEGFRFANTLSLLIGIALTAYLFFWPNLVEITDNNVFNTLYQLISFTVVYLSYIFVFYAISNFLNLFHLKIPVLDYIIVLGAGIIDGKVTPIVAGRVDRGIQLLKQQKKAKIVLSGGQGPDEIIPEGEAMAQYALEQGVSENDLMKETASRNTQENIQFSNQLITEDWQGNTAPKIALVTNNYHVLRALMLACKQGLNCLCFGSKTKFYFTLNAFIREYVAYLTMTYKVHLSVIGLVALMLVALFIINLAFS